MRDLVIYTAVTGNYDNLSAVTPEDNVNYLCFTDSEFQGAIPEPWKQIVLPESKLSNKDLARYCKLNPHLLLPQYQHSVWVDGNIIIRGGIKEHALDILSINDIAAYEHWWRDKTEQEFFECARSGFDPAWKLHHQLHRYRKEKYTSLNFFENNVIFRNHMKIDVINMHELWWAEYCNGGKRDQYSFTYAAFKSNVIIKSLGTHDPRLVKCYFDYKFHKSKRPYSQYLWIIINRAYIFFTGWKVRKPLRDNKLDAKFKGSKHEG